MATEPESLTLIFLRRIDEKVDRLIADVGDLKGRMTALEENLAGVHRRIDRLEPGSRVLNGGSTLLKPIPEMRGK
jgi:hypothetical protein